MTTFHDTGEQRRVLRVAPALNVVMFVVGLIAGVIGQSSGLIADSLDMSANASRYVVALSLHAPNGFLEVCEAEDQHTATTDGRRHLINQVSLASFSASSTVEPDLTQVHETVGDFLAELVGLLEVQARKRRCEPDTPSLVCLPVEDID